MHRSGTSVLTRGLQVLGVELSERLLPPNQYNPSGFWEDVDVLGINEKVLAALAKDWRSPTLIAEAQWQSPKLEALATEAELLLTSRLEQHHTWGVKDPRLCLLLPFWQPIFQRLGLAESYVIALRNPRSVAGSLDLRDQMVPELSYLLWLEHLNAALLNTAGKRRVLVDYDELLRQPREQLCRIAKELELTAPGPDNPALRDYERAFLDDALRHHQYPPEASSSDSHLTDLAMRAFWPLRAVAMEKPGVADGEIRSVTDTIQTELATVAAVLPLAHQLDQRIQARETDLAASQWNQLQLQRELTGLNATIQSLSASIKSLRAEGESIRAERALLRTEVTAFRQDRVSTHNLLLEEINHLWNSASWRVLRKLCNLVRSFYGTAKETEPTPGSAAEALQTVITIRQSLSWEMTAPLRVIARLFRRDRGIKRSAAAPLSGTPAMSSRPANDSKHRDFELIRDDGSFDPDFFLSPLAPRVSINEAIEAFLRQTPGDYKNRKPRSGFNPEIYAAEALIEAGATARNPFADFIEKGKPQGRWLTPLIEAPLKTPGPSGLRLALHVHAFYPELAGEFLECLASNSSRCDLFISTGSDAQVESLKDQLRTYARGGVQFSIVPNRGRDLGPFLTEYNFLDGNYDLVGHVHFKKSLYADRDFGELWRRFLWRNLLGPDHPMLDAIARSFENDPALGLVFPDDPNLVGWSSDKELAADLAQRMQLNLELPNAFEFPAGTMFWCRPAALRPLFELGLAWEDYPPEPTAMDGTILHAIERLLPFVAQHQGYGFATSHIPGLSNIAVSQPPETIGMPNQGAAIIVPTLPGAGETQPQAEALAILQGELRSLWNSQSWQLLRPLRNFARKRRGLPRETEPFVLSPAEAIQAIFAIRQSWSWELTMPLRLIGSIFGGRTTPEPIAQATIADVPAQPIEPLPEAFGRIGHLKGIVAPLKLDISARASRRVNVLVSTIDFKYLYGGYIAVFSLALKLVEHGYRTRIVIVDHCDYQPDSWREQIKGYPPLDGLFDKVEVEYRFDRSRPLTVSPADAFLATSWWTAHVAHDAATQLKQKRFVYLTQEYEPVFYEAGTIYAMAEESYTFPHYALFSTELLRDYSRQHKIGVFSASNGTGDANSVSFQNAIVTAGVSLERIRQRNGRRLLFYARPERHAARNLFEMGVTALTDAIEEGHFDLKQWQFDGIGTLRAHRLALGNRAELQMLARVTLDEYINLLPSYDLGLSLMLTPHPSLVPLDMAAAGMVTVTNTYANKTAATLEAISGNLIAVPATFTGIKEGLVRALSKVDDLESRVAGAQIHWQTRWSDALGDAVMDKLKWFIDHPNG